jgi:hypothetical protein
VRLGVREVGQRGVLGEVQGKLRFQFERIEDS